MLFSFTSLYFLSSKTCLNCFKLSLGQVWWHMAIIAALGSLRQEDCCELEANLGYMEMQGQAELCREALPHPSLK